MLLEILLFFSLGFVFGVFLGLVPGIHPNMIVLFVPLLYFFDMQPLPFLAFVVSLAVTNAVVDFIPATFLGAPEPGSELAVLPGQRMLLQGHGHDAVKLAAIGSLGAVLLVVASLPLAVFSVPFFYGLLRPYIHILLAVFVFFIVFTENTARKKMASFFVFLFSGAVGVFGFNLPLNETFILFPVLSGFFGISALLLQLRVKTKIPAQNEMPVYVSRKTINRSVLKGALGGVFSGFLPGVGTSQIAAVISREKNDKSFLVSLGAISAGNILLSILSLWLIGKARSGAAVAISEFYSIGYGEFLFIVAVSLLACGLAVAATVWLSKKVLFFLEKADYSKTAAAVIAFVVFLTAIFTGVYGLLLLVLSAACGIFSSLAGIKRGVMMGVLILPTIFFYAGI